MKKKLRTKSIYNFFNKKFQDSRFLEAYKEVNPLMKVAIAIAVARNSVGLSQKDLAKRLKTSQSVVSRIENGNQNLSIKMLANIARVLGRSFSIHFEPEETCDNSPLSVWKLAESFDSSHESSSFFSELEIIKKSDGGRAFSDEFREVQ
jgi:transcriptional regulator with XRE-family HTH domain